MTVVGRIESALAIGDEAARSRMWKKKSDGGVHFTGNYIQIATNQDMLAIPQHLSSLSFYYCHRHASVEGSG